MKVQRLEVKWGGDVPKVTVLNCPRCGAPLPQDALNCDFCGARVEISADGTRVVLAGVACPHCGVDNAPTRLFCGRCGAELVQCCASCGQSNRLGLEYCGRCGLELGEARRLTAHKLRQEAMRNGLNHVWGHVEEYKALYEQVAAPGETVIVFLARRHRETTLQDNESGYASNTALVATDRSFIFVEPEGWRLRGGALPSIARRIPFEEVMCVKVDVAGEQLVIRFDGGEARLSLRRLARDWRITDCQEAAQRVVEHFKPFLPLRLQKGW